MQAAAARQSVKPGAIVGPGIWRVPMCRTRFFQFAPGHQTAI